MKFAVEVDYLALIDLERTSLNLELEDDGVIRPPTLEYCLLLLKLVITFSLSDNVK